MSFKYLDPGYGISWNSRVGVYKSTIYNPRNGVAFYASLFSCEIHPVDSSTELTEFWVKFDIFLPETGNATSSIYKDNNSNKILLTIIQNGSSISARLFGEAAYELTEGFKAGSVNTIWLHFQATDYWWYIALVVNGEDYGDDCSSSKYVGATSAVFNFRISSEHPVSNLIISDEKIDLNETIIEVKHSAVETTMVENDGAYSSAFSGNYVLQTLDTTNLYGLFGSDSKVTGLVAIAAPAYTTDENVIEELKCRVVDDTTTTDYTPYFEYLEKWSDEEVAGLEYIPVIANQLDVTSDTTFASLNGLKVGWVTA